ncbi:MAG: ATP phosphoribosyltransferase [Pseudomonadota bacterium]
MTSSVTLALPSKGRLKEACLEVFANAGLEVEPPSDPRSYRGSVPSQPGLEIVFLSASEIARDVAAGRVHMGVTGLDLAHENIPDFDASLAFEVPLGFGFADVVVGVPEAWFDVETMDDLGAVAGRFRSLYGRPMKVATKYVSITNRHFAAHGVDLYRIIESLGATEAAPAAGSADIIVDITTTGSTLRANHLKQIVDGTMLESQATLMRSKLTEPDAEQLDLIGRTITSLRAV